MNYINNPSLFYGEKIWEPREQFSNLKKIEIKVFFQLEILSLGDVVTYHLGVTNQSRRLFLKKLLEAAKVDHEFWATNFQWHHNLKNGFESIFVNGKMLPGYLMS